MPKVSIILNSYNHQKHVKESIESVLAQSYQNFELIIFDDASSDRSLDIIKKYHDSRIKLITNKDNMGLIYCRNKAINEIATGDNIAIQNSDDVWKPAKLKNQLDFLDHNQEIGAVFTNAMAIGENGSPLQDPNHFYATIFNQPDRTRHQWLNYFFYSGNALCHPSILIRKKCYDDCGLYRYGFNQIADLDLWIRLCQKYEIKVLPEELVCFRIRDNELNISGQRPENIIRYGNELFLALKQYFMIRDSDELFKIFPDLVQLNRGKDTMIDYVLGMACLGKEPSNVHAHLGHILLNKILNNQDLSQKAKQLYGFSDKHYMAIIGKNDSFSFLPESLKLTTTIYIGLESGFNEDNKLSIKATAISMNGLYRVKFNLQEIFRSHKAASANKTDLNLRWDPLEGKSSMCKVLKVLVDGTEVQAKAINAWRKKTGWDIFITPDPSYSLFGNFLEAKEVQIEFIIKNISTDSQQPNRHFFQKLFFGKYRSCSLTLR